MAKKPELKRNGYSDEDLDQIVQRIEEAKDIEADEKSAASDKRKRAIKIIEAEAKNVGVLIPSLRKLIKVRTLQRKIKAEVDGVPKDEIEVFSDMQGQLTFLRPVNDGETDAQVAARERIAQIARISEAEQEEGAAVLDELGGAVH